MSPLLSTRAGASARAFGFLSPPSGPLSGFESIATVVATGSTADIAFTAIPQNYVALQIRSSFRIASGTLTTLRMTFNNESGTFYANHALNGDGATATATGAGSMQYINTVLGFGTSGVGVWGAGIIDIHDYASTGRLKTARVFTGRDANGSGTVSLSSGLFLITAPITTIRLYYGGAGALSGGSTFALYGIKGAS